MKRRRTDRRVVGRRVTVHADSTDGAALIDSRDFPVGQSAEAAAWFYLQQGDPEADPPRPRRHVAMHYLYEGES